jgi:hypothetical protein
MNSMPRYTYSERSGAKESDYADIVSMPCLSLSNYFHVRGKRKISFRRPLELVPSLSLVCSTPHTTLSSRGNQFNFLLLFPTKKNFFSAHVLFFLKNIDFMGTKILFRWIKFLCLWRYASEVSWFPRGAETRSITSQNHHWTKKFSSDDERAEWERKSCT